MDALYALPDLPTPLPPSPAAATTATTSTRRKRTVSPLEEAVEPAPKAKRVRSTAQEKAAKKSARMERNRIAAQVSRDRKKQQTEYLEQRVAELEAQLAAGLSPIATTCSTISPSPTFTLPALPPAPPPATDPLLVGQLREENESLKTQLALEKLASQALQIRLSSLEAKFGRLEQLLSGGGSGGGAEVKPVVQVKQDEKEHKSGIEQEKESQSLLPGVSPSSSFTEKDSSRLVAREVDQSLQRKLSHPFLTHTTFTTPSPTTSTTSPLPSTSPSLLLPALRQADSNSTLTSRSTSSPRPSLHQILSSIKVSPAPAPSSLRTTSFKPGRTGPTSSTRLRLSSTTSSSRLRSTSRRARSSTSSPSSSAKMRALRDQRSRWRLVVRR